MLDRKFILENVEAVKENCKNRNVVADVDRFVELETTRREKQRDIEVLNQESNAVSKSIGKCKTPEERDAKKEEGRLVREKIAAVQAELNAIETELDKIQRGIPNMAHPDSPIGKDDTCNCVVGYGKTPVPQWSEGFKPLDHVEIAEKYDLIDFEGGARVAGAGFYFLKNEAVLLELALEQFAVNKLVARGFTPTITPDLAKNDVLQGTGYIPRGNETQIYSIDNSDLSLIATAEITLGGLLAGQTVDSTELPLKLCGVSHCFRTEAGAAGRASRGLYRVHQFSKVEMFVFCLPDQSEAFHQELLSIEREIFDDLEIPYQIVDTATGDLGGPAYRKFDIEAWMPGRGTYGEVTSTSNCTDYQARRLNARYKVKGEKGTNFVHTLNGTAVAISRALLAVLEMGQREDGTVVVPKALRPYVPFVQLGELKK
ncbi:MAG: serine--tRNA ligase [Thermoguttaceae bacterium]|nr:serine--tRNA ligase [Thermoguttaceae bacterium]